MTRSTLITNIGQLATLAPLARAKRYINITDQDLETLDNAWLTFSDGKISGYGSGKVPATNGKTFDAKGGLVIPGLVDAHTHAIFGGSRAHEFSARLAGKTYQDIAKQGGGIAYTVQQTRAASDHDLEQFLRNKMKRFTSLGVTTVEVKSGYGLSTSEELRILRIINTVAQSLPGSIVATCLALHARPKEFASNKEYIAVVCDELLPQVAKEKLASYVDAFVENGYFSTDEIAPYLEKAQSLGLGIRLHADEFSDAKAALAAANYSAASADHLEHTPESAMKAMAKAGTVAVLLPGTSLYTKIPFAKAQPFKANGVAVALATDFNPGSCFIDNLPFITTMGAIHCGLTRAEALAAVTLVAAKSLNLENNQGHLSEGAFADLAMWPHKTLDMWLADLGQTAPSVVFKRGEIVCQNASP